MRIVHMSTYERFGGAARAAHRLHEGLRRIGTDSTMLVEKASTSDRTTRRFEPSTHILSRLRRRLRRERIERDHGRYARSRPKDVDTFSDDRTCYGREVVEQIPSCDVVNLHWTASFVDYESFFGLVPQRVPVVWTLHDMNAVTGGCHYTMGCQGPLGGCGACPQLGSRDARDLSYRVFERKRRVLAGVPPKRLHIVAPSRWLANEVRQSVLGRRFDVSVIPYGLDMSVFAPRQRDAAREILGLPARAKVVLFVAQDLDKERKGYDLLKKAIEAVAAHASDVCLVSVGRSGELSTSIPGTAISQVSDDRFLSCVYSTADVFVIASREDNFPNTVLEAMACGVPVVGFRVGGVADMVRPDITGLLVEPFDATALASAIRALLEDSSRQQWMAINCRRIAEEEYGLSVQARRYADLYSRMTAAAP